MNELDREMILAQRGEERDAAIERRRNAKMAAQAQQAAMAVSSSVPTRGLASPAFPSGVFCCRDLLGMHRQASASRGVCLQCPAACLVLCLGAIGWLSGAPLRWYPGGGRWTDAIVNAGETAGRRQKGRVGGAAGGTPEEDPAQRVTVTQQCGPQPRQHTTVDRPRRPRWPAYHCWLLILIFNPLTCCAPVR